MKYISNTHTYNNVYATKEQLKSAIDSELSYSYPAHQFGNTEIIDRALIQLGIFDNSHKYTVQEFDVLGQAQPGKGQERYTVRIVKNHIVPQSDAYLLTVEVTS